MAISSRVSHASSTSLLTALRAVQDRSTKILDAIKGIPSSIPPKLLRHATSLRTQLRALYKKKTPPGFREAVRQALELSLKIHGSLEEMAVFSLPLLASRRQRVLEGLRDNIVTLRKYLEVAYDNVQVAPARLKSDKGASPELKQFLQHIKGRGWKVRQEEVKEKEQDTDLFAQSKRLMVEQSVPKTNLLPPQEFVGVVKCPIVVMGTARLPNRIIQACENPEVGYNVEQVFGRYWLISGMRLMGIHRDAMHIYENGSKKKTKLDTAKFRALVPFLENQSPEMAEILQHIRPVFPARLKSHHYYCPLMPMSVSTYDGFSLREWSLLTEQQGIK